MPNATHYAQTEPHPAQLITIHAVAAPTRKRRGEAAEAAFLARATALGFSVCIPWGDSNRYDSSSDKSVRPTRVILAPYVRRSAQDLLPRNLRLPDERT